MFCTHAKLSVGHVVGLRAALGCPCCASGFMLPPSGYCELSPSVCPPSVFGSALSVLVLLTHNSQRIGVVLFLFRGAMLEK